MSFFKKLFSRQADASSQVEKTGLFGLKLGAVFTVDPLSYKVTEAVRLITFPGNTQQVEAVGELDLGAGSRLYRYYTADDAYLQFSVTGALEPQNIDDMKLFVYDDSMQVGSDADWDHWLRAEVIGKPSYEYRGETFVRAFSAHLNSAVPPVALTEQVENRAGDHYRLDNFCMLYQREVLPGQFEYLLINAEESEDGRLVSFSLGADTNEHQLQFFS